MADVMDVSILTPYLTEDMSAFYDPAEVAAQKMFYGYEEDNLQGTERMEADDLEVRINTPYGHERRARRDDLLVVGNNPESEDLVREFKGTGLLVARYSTFYGAPSGYTGRTPEEIGYSFDVPKRVATAAAFLTDEPTLEGILHRDENEIRDAVGELNEDLHRPVLVTDYLAEALQEG